MRTLLFAAAAAAAAFYAWYRGTEHASEDRQDATLSPNL